MARPKGKKASLATSAQPRTTKRRQRKDKDVYEEEEIVDKDEFSGKYDVDTTAEPELPSDFEDEEISEDDAFNSDDERVYGSMFSKVGQKEQKKGKAHDMLEESDSEASRQEDTDQSDEENVVPEGMMNLSDLLGTAPQKALPLDRPSHASAANGAQDLNPEFLGEDSDNDEDNEARHNQMLQSIGLSGNRGNNNRKVQEISATTAESEFSNTLASENLTMDALMSSITQTSAGIGQLKKQLVTVAPVAETLQAPAAAVVEKRAQRKVAFEQSKEEVSKFQVVVRSNRRADTLNFIAQQAPPRQNLSHGALSSKFAPQTDMEKEIQSALGGAGLTERKVVEEELEALERKTSSLEEAKEKHAEIAKLRSLMFYEEQKRKRISKIKSKLYHKIRNKQKSRKDGEDALENLDPEDARQMEAEAAEKRAAERMSLRHQNNSKWIKNVLKKGQAADQGSREAVGHQLREAQELRRKMNRVGENNSSDESEDDQTSLSQKAQGVLAGIDADETAEGYEGKHSGLLGMKFMQRAYEKQRQNAREEAVDLLRQLEEENENSASSDEEVSNRKSNKSQKRKSDKKPPTTEDVTAVKKMLSEEDMQISKVQLDRRHKSRLDGMMTVPLEESHEEAKLMKATATAAKNSKSETPEDEDFVILRSSAPSISQEMPNKKRKDEQAVSTPLVQTASSSSSSHQNPWLETAQYSEAQELRGIHGKKRKLTAAKALAGNNNVIKVDLAPVIGEEAHEDKKGRPLENKASTAARSTSEQDAEAVQRALVKRAFALADDGLDEIAQEKEALAELDSNSKFNKKEIVGVAGWGSWTGQGVKPSLRQKAREALANKKQKEEKDKALAKRQDAKLKHVVINEKRDKKAAKFLAAEVPYPFTSREQYERAIRAPIGTQWNTAIISKEITRPEVITRAGMVINPIKLTKGTKRQQGDSNNAKSSQKRRKF